jgi:hypothetical protein
MWKSELDESCTLLKTYYFSNKILLSYNADYWFLTGFGDTDTIFFNDYHYPIALAQINIAGLGFDDLILFQTGELALYPNPANNILNLVFEQENEYMVQVYDISGKLVLQKELNKGESQLAVSELKSGLYILRAQSNEAVFVGRFLKE